MKKMKMNKFDQFVRFIFILFTLIQFGVVDCLQSNTECQPFSWTALPTDDYYHFVGHLEFCYVSNGDTPVYGYRDLSLPEGAPCCSPGPTIVLTAGLNYKMVLHNSMPFHTNLHTHGLHISGSGNGDSVFRTVDPDMCLGYNWSVPAFHHGGTFWVHSHVHGSTYSQVSHGALAMLIVADADAGDEIAAIPPQLPAPDKLLIKALLGSEIRVVAAKRVDCVQLFADVSSQSFTVPPLSWVRLRLLVVNPRGVKETVHFQAVGSTADANCQVRAIAFDGNFLSQVPSAPGFQWTTTGAGRIDFALSCAEDFAINIFGEQVPFRVSHLDSSLVGASELVTWSPVRPPYLRDLRDEVVPAANKHTAWASMSSVSWDGVSFQWPAAPYHTCSDTSMQVGQVYELTLSSTISHPLHLHVFPMQVISGCPDYLQGEWYDTISSSSVCTVRFNAFLFGDTVVLHCHYLMHEDMGAMTYLQFCGGSDLGPLTDPPVLQAECSEYV